ncbi:hypothetical protein MEM_03605 [Candida albicans L26]|uniref:Ribonuclease H2 non-catalytic subunit (Ylr154p-like) family protein n=2 Tax=Candida albicans TaxID=5476 RepID=A0A8H6C4V9_CANAX|nr:Ribonuclease H2 non-catalytic subunit (Ylr154p-like) family protein [Candida albicans]KGR09445.1 hypothetical protein MG3_03631 [Candida albicans P78048]KGU09330.1 hypothetical protein MEY_03573 [Candida albicans 19F]KGU09830.1 hypothetical protein MEM_03605 [Candida albicans L26]KHC53333.1 hypothetical protein MGC_03603 [Candida albicans P37039]KHC76447.1 hypothetical protein MGS_03614 [Candida albicans P78042]KHC77635.1 hypothetical protein W5Q_03639 [Candida albicans SC5314]
MSTIKITNESAKEVVASVVPMNIQYSGPANTEDYFAPSKTQETQPDGTLLDVAYFRGCKLVGKTLELDKYDVKGYVINKSEHLVSDKETGEVKTAVTYIPVGNFQKLTVYGHDTLPSRTNQWSLIPEYLSISNIVNE